MMRAFVAVFFVSVRLESQQSQFLALLDEAIKLVFEGQRRPEEIGLGQVLRGIFHFRRNAAEPPVELARRGVDGLELIAEQRIFDLLSVTNDRHSAAAPIVILQDPRPRRDLKVLDHVDVGAIGRDSADSGIFENEIRAF